MFSDSSYLCHTAVPEQITLAKGAESINRCRHGSQAISILTRMRIEELDPHKRERVLGRKNIHCPHQVLREVATPKYLCLFHLTWIDSSSTVYPVV